jgi:hypothetical protein
MANHVIFSRNADNSALTLEQIQHRAPAAFSTTKAERLSDRYISLNTSDVLPIMADYGYLPTQAAQKRSRKASTEHAAHMLAFSKTTDIVVEAGDIRPEIILYNSHDGTGSVKLFAGVFRFICSNGIVAGDGFQSRIYHSKALNGFEEMLRNTVATLPDLMGRIDKMRGVSLSVGQAHDMAIAGVATRWDDYTGQTRGAYAVAQTVKDVMNVRRNGDEGYDAFTVFNRIQEGVIRGNAMIRSITEQRPEGVMRKARPVNSIKEAVRINTELWNIAEDIAFA